MTVSRVLCKIFCCYPKNKNVRSQKKEPAPFQKTEPVRFNSQKALETLFNSEDYQNLQSSILQGGVEQYAFDKLIKFSS